MDERDEEMQAYRAYEQQLGYEAVVISTVESLLDNMDAAKSATEQSSGVLPEPYYYIMESPGYIRAMASAYKVKLPPDVLARLDDYEKYFKRKYRETQRYWFKEQYAPEISKHTPSYWEFPYTEFSFALIAWEQARFGNITDREATQVVESAKWNAFKNAHGRVGEHFNKLIDAIRNGVFTDDEGEAILPIEDDSIQIASIIEALRDAGFDDQDIFGDKIAYMLTGWKEGDLLEFDPRKFGTQYLTLFALVSLMGYGGAVRQVIKPPSAAKREAAEAGQLEKRAAVIDYRGFSRGLRVGYSEACAQFDEMLMKEFTQDQPQLELEYLPDGWGAQLRAVLPKTEVEEWKEADGNPAQLKRLRAAVYEILTHEQEPYWWKRNITVSITLNQIVRALYYDNKKPTEDEIDLIGKSMAMLIKTDIDSVYPNPDKHAKKYQTINKEALKIKGLRVFPAVLGEHVNARGHVVDATYEFYALPPLEYQANGINHAYQLPYLRPDRLFAPVKGKVSNKTYDVLTVLGKYIRMAREHGRQTIYIDDLAREVEPFRHQDLERQIKAAEFMGDGDVKRKRQMNLRDLRRRVKKDAQKALPRLVEKEALRENNPCYLNVSKANSNRDGFTITVLKQTEKEKKAHEKPKKYGVEY